MEHDDTELSTSTADDAAVHRIAPSGETLWNYRFHDEGARGEALALTDSAIAASGASFEPAPSGQLSRRRLPTLRSAPQTVPARARSGRAA